MENLTIGTFQGEAFFSHLWKYIEDSTVTDVLFCSGMLWIKRINHIPEQIEDPDITAEFMALFANKIENEEGKRFNQMYNILYADTPTLRITCLHESLAVSGISVCIRKSEPKLRFDYESAIRDGYCEKETMNLLINCVLAKKSFVFCGMPGHGKTEAIKFFSQYNPPFRKVVTIEDVNELHYPMLNPGKACDELKVGDRNYKEVLSAALRMNPDWIFLAETRSREVRYLLECWSNGLSTMTTMHTNDARNVPDRVLNMLEERIDADRIVNQIFNDVGVSVLCDEIEIGGGETRHIIRQVCFYQRKNDENRMFLIVDDGVLYPDRFPEDIRSNIEKKIGRDIFTLPEGVM